MKRRIWLFVLSIAAVLGFTTVIYANDAQPVMSPKANVASGYYSSPAISGAKATAISSVKLQYTSTVYTGLAKTPTVTVKAKVNGKTKTLKKNTDYTVSYKNNKNVGTATVTVKGKGKYSGTKTAKFKITAVALSTASLSYTSTTYTGSAKKPAATVKAKVNGKTKTLKKDTDYTVSYKNNINAGKATVTIKGKGNYKNTLTKNFTIKTVPLSSVTLSDTTTTYTGNAIEPTATVKAKVNGKTKTLNKKTDYTVSYSDNINIGKATVTVKGKGNYSGTKKAYFEIVPAGFIDPINEWDTYDQLISEIKSTTDSARRVELMHQAEDILMSTNAIVPLYYYNDIYLQKTYVSNVYATVYGTKYFMYASNANGDSIHANLAEEPYTLDPAFSSSVDEASMIALFSSGLFAYNENGMPDFACAQSCDVSEDGRTYTVRLKEGLKWSDGSDLTAQDFEYSWKRVADPELKADYGYLFEIFEGYDTPEGISVTAIDPHTLVFVLNEPCAYMEDLMAFPAFCPVPQAYVEGNPDWCKEAGFVSNGAFTCTSWEHNQQISFSKNPYFWNADSVTLNNIDFLLSGENNYELYAAGQLDFIEDFPPEIVEEYLQEKNPELHIIDTIGTYYMQFNVHAPLFEGKTPYQAACIREAISLLINRAAINTGTQRVEASTFVPIGMADGNGGVFHVSNADGYYDPYAINYFPDETIARAVSLLKYAGFKFTEEGVLSPDTPISIDFLYNDSGYHLEIANIIKESLEILGIEWNPVGVGWGSFQGIIEEGNYTAARGGWIADYNDPINFLDLFITASGNNTPHFGK